MKNGTKTGADPGFLERGFKFTKGVRFLVFPTFQINPHENEIIWPQRGVPGSSKPPEPPLDPPLKDFKPYPVWKNMRGYKA